MNSVDVIDNFVDQKNFSEIQQLIFSDVFPWYYGKYKVETINHNINNYQFVHMFYYNYGIRSDYFDILNPMLEKLNVKSLVKVKINLTTVTEKIYDFELHTDVDFECKTAILYLNTNNGYTTIGDEKISSIENRIVVFNSQIPHSGSTCSDQSVRCVLNINYF